MNAEAQKLMDTINRLMSKGMSRDDDTIKTLEGLIEDELSKGETDDAFLQRPAQDPRIQRPGNKQFRPEDFTSEDDVDSAGPVRPGERMEMDEGGNLTPEEYERQNPNWREEEMRIDREGQDLSDVQRMMSDWKRGPDAHNFELSDNMGGIFDHGIPPGLSKNMGPFPNQPISPFEPRAHYGFNDIPALLNEVPNPATENMSDRRSFQRPSAGPSTEEELDMIMKGAEDEPIYEDEYE